MDCAPGGYPETIVSFTTAVPGNVINANDTNTLTCTTYAIETTLGTNPQSTYDTVADSIADRPTLAQIQYQELTYGDDTGTANNYQVTLDPTPALGPGLQVVFKAQNANTGNSSLTVNGNTATLVKNGSVILTGGEIEPGQIIPVVYDGSSFQIVGGSGSGGGSANITLTGDVTGSGSGTVATTISATGVTAGTYPKVTVNAKGQVTAGTTLSPSDIPATYSGQTSITTVGTISSGTWNGTPIAVAYGGTGATTAAAALTNLGAASGGANSNITSLSGLTTPLSPAQGGTGQSSYFVNPGLCEGRLTLSSTLPVTTTDMYSAAIIYFLPYTGNLIALYDGSSTWNIVQFSSTSISLAGGGFTAGTIYDLFAYNNSGTLAFDSPVAWSNSTTRSTLLTLQDGVWVKSGSTSRRYIGSFVATGSTTTADSGTPDGTGRGRYLYNAQNRVLRAIQGQSSTNFSTTSTSLVAPDSTDLVLAFLHGLSDNYARLSWQTTAYVSSISYVGYFGLSSTSSGGSYLSPSQRTVNLTTMHTESGEYALNTLGLNTIYLNCNVYSSSLTLTMYVPYTPAAVQAYIWC